MKKRILVIRLGSLGDIILTSAALVNLKIRFPESHITYLCKERYAPLVERMGTVDEIRTVPDKVSMAAFVKLLADIDKSNYYTVVDLHGNLRSWLARKFITADRTVLYPKRRLDRVLAVKGKNLPVSWPHTIDLYNEAVIQAGAKDYCRRPNLPTPAVELDEKFRAFESDNRRYVVVAPGAAHENKQWPIERFVETAVQLHRHQGTPIVWMITDTDRDKLSPKGEIDPGAYIELVNAPFDQLLSVLSGAVLTVANDSGIAHASSSVGVPVIAVFGPTHPALGFAPKGLYDRVVQVDQYCRPCSLHGKKPCYRDKRYCFEQITPDMVVAQAAELHQVRIGESRGVFVDRDGTIIKDKNFLSNPDEIEFETGSVEALRLLNRAGYKIVIVSNQSGVARGYFDTATVDMVNAKLMEMLSAEHIEIAGVYYCPHHPKGTVNRYAIRCECRKPGAAMAEDAAYQLGIDLRKSYVIGDKVDDVNFGRVIGSRPILVKTGYGAVQSGVLEKSSFYDDVPVVANLLEAVKKIVSEQ